MRWGEKQATEIEPIVGKKYAIVDNQNLALLMPGRRLIADRGDVVTMVEFNAIHALVASNKGGGNFLVSLNQLGEICNDR